MILFSTKRNCVPIVGNCEYKYKNYLFAIFYLKNMLLNIFIRSIMYNKKSLFLGALIALQSLLGWTFIGLIEIIYLTPSEICGFNDFMRKVFGRNQNFFTILNFAFA